MKNKLLGIILWVATLLVVAGAIGLGSLLYGITIRNSNYCDVGVAVIVTVSIMYMVTILSFYIISKFMND